jgi:hypothetical protein
MDLGAALITRLHDNATIAGIVGNRIYWNRRPQGTEVPAIVMRFAGGFAEENLDCEPSDFIHTNVTVDCFGKTDVQTKSLARAVAAELKPPATVDGFTFDASDVSEPIDLGELDVVGWQNRAALDCTIRHGNEE